MRRFFLVLFALPLVLLAAACGGGGGGGSSVSGGDVAVVNGEHISRATLDERMKEAACGYKLQKRTFPKPGSTEYQGLRAQIVQNLVQRAQLDQQAPKLKVSVTDKQVEDQLKSLKKQYFGGSEKRYQAELKKQCVGDAQVRDDVRASLLSEGIKKKLTAGASVSPSEVRSYYDAHRQVYTTPQTRVVSHILVKNKALADRLYAQLKAGASFAALAKKYSTDPGSKANGGQLTITRGQTVPEFDRTAFALRTGALSKPVHTQYGWHIIHADKTAKPRQSTPFAQVKASIGQQLLQQKQSEALQKWLTGLTKEYAGKISYAAGLAPPATTTAATTTG
jgi:parvulin-like peptidyl-prolyl isomerase